MQKLYFSSIIFKENIFLEYYFLGKLQSYIKNLTIYKQHALRRMVQRFIIWNLSALQTDTLEFLIHKILTWT
jgi:hypothetical protein